MLTGIFLGMLIIIFPQIVFAYAFTYPFYIFIGSCCFVSIFYNVIERERETNYVDRNIWTR